MNALLSLDRIEQDESPTFLFFSDADN